MNPKPPQFPPPRSPRLKPHTPGTPNTEPQNPEPRPGSPPFRCSLSFSSASCCLGATSWVPWARRAPCTGLRRFRNAGMFQSLGSRISASGCFSGFWGSGLSGFEAGSMQLPPVRSLLKGDECKLSAGHGGILQAIEHEPSPSLTLNLKPPLKTRGRNQCGNAEATTPKTEPGSPGSALLKEPLRKPVQEACKGASTGSLAGSLKGILKGLGFRGTLNQGTTWGPCWCTPALSSLPRPRPPVMQRAFRCFWEP